MEMGPRLPFPDFSAILVRQPEGAAQEWKEVHVDLNALLRSGDCSKDVPLPWGTLVIVPVIDHPINEGWSGLTAKELESMKKCLTRNIALVVNGQTNQLTVAPRYEVDARSGLFKDFLTGESFWLKAVVLNSKLVLASSDLSRVCVTRRDPATGNSKQIVLDCSEGKASPRLWLRDGDLVEVPEKK